MKNAKTRNIKLSFARVGLKMGFVYMGINVGLLMEKRSFFKKIITNNYKRKLCKSFKESGICLYGARCNFQHNDKKLCDIKLLYYFCNLFLRNEITLTRRLQIFEDISNLNQNANENWSVSTYSNDDAFLIKCSIEQRKEVEEMEFPLESILRFMI